MNKTSQLLSAESIYRKIPIPTYIWQVRKNQIVLIDFNDAALKYSGAKLTKLLHKTATDIYHDLPDILNAMKECRDTQKTITRELSIPLRTTGAIRFLDCTWTWIDPDLILFHAQDQTEIKQAKQALEEKVVERTAELQNALIQIEEDERFLNQTFDSIQEGICVLDADMNIVKTNHTMDEMYDLTPSGIGNKCYKTFHRNRQGVCDFCPAAKTISEKVPNKAIIQARNIKDDSLLWTEVFTFPMLDPLGELTGVIEIVRDITERKKNEEKLQKSEEKYHALTDNLTSGIVVHAADSSVVFSNPMASNLLGLTAEQMRGKEIIDPAWCFLRADGATMPVDEYPFQRVLTSKAAVSDYVVGVYRPGLEKPIWTQCNAYPIFNKQEELDNIVVVITDITALKEEEEQRSKLEQQLHLKNKMEAVGFMAGGMAHNFNNNLSIILGNVELSQMKQVPSSEAIPLLENAKIAVRRSRDLIQKIITYSRQGETHRSPMQLPTIIDETIDLLSSTMPATITLKKSYSPDSRSNLVNADPSQIQEILINLCNNAIHAMNEKGNLKITLDPVELEQKDIPAQYDCLSGRYAKLSVQDNGCGIHAETLDKIFDPFYSTKEEYEGAGMGLSTVQGIVAQHGGVIKVNSVVGLGTTFNLYFPIIEQTKIDALTAEDTTLPSGTERILFIDDDKRLATLGEQLLSTLGYQVSMMTDSTEALKMFTANSDSFDLVMTDQTMPDLTGKDLIEEIKKVRADIPTILCTGYSSKIDKDESEKLGIGAFMMKPLDLPALSQTVRKVLDGKTEK